MVVTRKTRRHDGRVSPGFKGKKIRFMMRMFVGDILKNKKFYELNNFYKFIHNVRSFPNKEDALKFLHKIKDHQKKGYLDFKDELIIVSR